MNKSRADQTPVQKYTQTNVRMWKNVHKYINKNKNVNINKMAQYLQYYIQPTDKTDGNK